jgi:hypothetical protein
MSGRRAKRLRRAIYGEYSFRHRTYTRQQDGSLVADARRQAYQQAKRAPQAQGEA